MPEMISRYLSVKLARWLQFWTWGIVGSCVVHETQLSVSWLLCPCQLIWRRECCHTTYRAWPFIISCELQVGSYWQTIFYLIFVQHLAKWDLISNYCCQNTGIRWMHHSSAASSGGMYRIATTSDKTPDTSTTLICCLHFNLNPWVLKTSSYIGGPWFYSTIISSMTCP